MLIEIFTLGVIISGSSVFNYDFVSAFINSLIYDFAAREDAEGTQGVSGSSNFGVWCCIKLKNIV